MGRCKDEWGEVFERMGKWVGVDGWKEGDREGQKWERKRGEGEGKG
jgi:hypothetical protein